MDAPARRTATRSNDEFDPDESIVTPHQTRPGKIVFTERNNCDGWIATDLAVDIEP